MEPVVIIGSGLAGYTLAQTLAGTPTPLVYPAMPVVVCPPP